MDGNKRQAQDFGVVGTSGTFWILYNRLMARAPFVYTRFGDGEFEMMLGHDIPSHKQDANLAAEMRELYVDLDYDNLIGIAMHKAEPEMRPGLFAPWQNPEYDEFKIPRLFENAIALHFYAVFKPGVLRRLFDLIRMEPKVFLGSTGGPKLERLIGEYTEINIPSRDAYETIDEWYPKLEEAVRQLPAPKIVVASAGPAKCAVARRLLNSDMRVQFLDIGSVADFASSLATYTWIKIAYDEFPMARGVLLGGQ